MRRGWTRRRFLQQTAISGLFPLGCGDEGPTGPIPKGRVLLSAQGATPGTYGLVAVGEDGEPRRIAAGFRGHDVAGHPTRTTEVVLFARRPGREAMVADLWAGRAVRRLTAGPRRAFQGHGCFTEDGDFLFTSEADIERGTGKIGVWRTDRYVRVDELDTGGIGPHEIALLPAAAGARRVLVVANGGLLTRPQTGRRVLNLDTMDSTLTYLDLDAGRVDAQHRVAEPKASIRHFDIAPDGTVVFGAQVQREAAGHTRLVSLGGIHRRGEDVRELTDRLDVFGAMDDYVGSVAINARSRVAGFTSPRGDIAAFWDIDSAEFSGHHRLVDVSGLAAPAAERTFVLSSSTGELRTVRADDASEIRSARRRLENVAWDNHLLAVEWTA